MGSPSPETGRADSSRGRQGHTDPAAVGGREFARLCAASFAAYLSYAICRTPLLPLFAQQLGAGPSMIGVVVAASTLTGVLVKLPSGALSDVLGRKPLLLAGAFVFALLPFAYLAVTTIAGLILLRFVHGNATAIFGPVASATVSDLAPLNRRGAWLGAYATAQGAGQAVAPLLAGYLLAAGRFDVAFIVAGLIGLTVPAILAFAASSRTPSPLAPGGRWPAFREGVRDVVGHRLVLVTSAAHAAQFVLSGALNAFLPLYARDVVGLTTAQIGWLFAAQTITTLAVRPVVGRLSDSVARTTVIVCGLTLCSVTLWTLSLVGHGWMLAACLVVYAAGVATTSAATSAYITDITRRARYGAAHGVFGTIYDVGDAFGPIGAGLVVAALGYAAMFRLAAALGLVAAIAFAVASSRPPERWRRD
jgi:MFS family permease